MLKNKQVVFISYYRFCPDGMEQVVENVFSKELGRICDLIFLLQGDLRKGRIQRWNNADVWVSGLTSRKGLVGSALNSLYSLGKIIQVLRLIKKNGRSLIFVVRDLPIWASILGLFKIMVGYKMYFQYTAPLGMMNISYFRKHKTFKRYKYLFSGILHQAMLRSAIKRSDVVFPITESFGKYLSESCSCQKHMVPLTMGADERWINRGSGKILWLEELSKDHFIIGYFGTLSFLRDPDFFLRVFSRVHGRIKKCKLLLMGKIADPYEKQTLHSLSKKLSIEGDTIFAGKLNRNDLRDHLHYCALTISAIPPELYYAMSSPTKLYESLGLGIPVVANLEIYEHEKVIRESGGGALAPYDVDAFAEAIVRLCDSGNDLIEMGQKGREYILANYTYSALAGRISHLFV
jgi:glycosyltransferase involved in cell wall biosynthesis